MAIDFTSAFGIGSNSVTVGRLALDPQGNTVVTGTFRGSVSFDANSTGGNVLNSGNTSNAFVAKYSPTNTLLFVRQFADDESVPGGSAEGADVAVDRNTGAIYVGGSFTGKVDFDPGGNTRFLTSAGGSDGYVVKLTANGDLDSGFARRFGGTATDTVSAVTLDRAGANVYLTGTYTNTANFDPGGANTTLTSPVVNERDSYALKMSSNFGFGFAARVGLTNSSGADIGVDSQGGVYVTGTQGNAVSNAYVSKFNGLGNPITTRVFGGPASGGTTAVGTSLVVDAADNVYLGGAFQGTGVNFNRFNGPGTVALDSAGNFDAYLLKLDPSLTLTQARRFGSNGLDVGFDLAVDGSNQVYMTGTQSGQSSFGTTGLGTMVLDTGNGMTGTRNAFILAVSPAGDVVQAIGGKGTGLSIATSIEVDDAGRVAIAGVYTAPAIFGTTTLQSLGGQQFFVATLNPTPTGGGGGGMPGNGGGMPGNGNGGNGGAMTPAPTFVSEMRVFAGKGRKRRLVGFQLTFSGALDAVEAQNRAHYQVTQPGKKGRTTNIAVQNATYNPATNSVTLVLGKFKANKPLQLTATGLLGDGGAPVATIVSNL